nr:transporter associated domain-containing protein [Comamonas sp. JC664]
MVALRRHSSPEEIRRVLLEGGHSRMPVYEDTMDNIVGYVIAKDLLGVAWESNLIILEDVMRPPFFVVETMRAMDALRELQKRRMQLAVVVDERGGVVGLVTVEDLVEELVGDILSESEVPEELVKREGPNTALVLGSASIRDVNRALALDLDEDQDYATVAGLCIALSGGAIPGPGTQVQTVSGLTLEVVESSPRRVRTVRFHLPKRDEPAEA